MGTVPLLTAVKSGRQARNVARPSVIFRPIRSLQIAFYAHQRHLISEH